MCVNDNGVDWNQTQRITMPFDYLQDIFIVSEK